jgi:hypothetical protein
VGNNGRACEVLLKQDKEIIIPCFPSLKLILRQVSRSDISVSLKAEDKVGFQVTYYDMPFVDNSIMGE